MPRTSVVLPVLACVALSACQSGPRTHAPLASLRTLAVEYTGDVGPDSTAQLVDLKADVTGTRAAPTAERSDAPATEPYHPGDPLAVVETRFVSLDQDLAREWFGVNQGAAQAHLVDQVDAGRRLQTLVEHGEVDLLSCPRVTVAFGQTGEILTHRQVSYLSGYELEATENARIADPVVSVVQAGMGLEVRPTEPEQGDDVNLAVALHRVDLVDPMPLISSPLPGCGVEAELQVPVFLRQRVETTAPVGEQQTLMIAGLAGEDAGQTVLAFVSVRRVVAESDASQEAVDSAGG